MVNADEVILKLKSLANPDNVAGMARYGISPEGTLGVSVPTLRRMAKEVGKDHDLAARLWASGIHDARILAVYVDDPARVTEDQMEAWVADLDSWDVCDQVCGNLFDRTPRAYEKAAEWSERDEEFVKRAGFALMAWLPVHDKKAPDDKFLPFLAMIEREAGDDRNFVKKAVNWALRNIGKRSKRLNEAAIATARRISRQDSKSARWISSDALRELESDKIQQRFK